MRALTSAFCLTMALPMAWTGAAQAQTNPVVVELFTSQGCSSCPPADEMMQDMAKRSDIIALALHVDYWDYIGWKDEFASPQFTQRQHNYARAAGERTVYTPQFVVGGVDHVIGAKPMDVMDEIRDHASSASGVMVVLTRSGGTFHIEGTARQGARGPWVVQLVRYTPEQTVSIGRGENAGRTVTYSNVVTSWDVVGQWDGQPTFSADVPARGGAPAVVIVQQTGAGPILAAARLQ